MVAQLIAYSAVAVLSVAIGLFAFILFPSRRPLEEVAPTDARPAPGRLQQTSFSASLVSAAPRGYLGWIEKQVVQAGRPAGWSAERILTWKLVLAVLSSLLGLLFIFAGGPNGLKVVLVIAATAMLFVLPDVLINSRAHDRQQAIKYALPDTLDQMTIAVEAGLGFDAAMAKAARNGKGPLAEELIRVLQDMSIGRSRRDAFMELEHRTSQEDLRRFIRAVIQADQYGVAIGDVLRVQAGEMRLKRRQRAEEQAMKVTVKIIFPLVFCLLPVLFIVLLTPAALSMIETFKGFDTL